MTGFERDGDGKQYEARVRDTVLRLREMFPEMDAQVAEANLMVGRTWGALLALVNGAWANAGLTGHQLTALRLLLLAPGRRLTIKDITAGLSVGPTNVTKLVNRLERAGLVRRMEGTHDRRVTWVELTDLGADTYRALYPATQARHRAAFAVLSEEERRLLIDLLARVRQQALGLAAETDGAVATGPAEAGDGDLAAG